MNCKVMADPLPGMPWQDKPSDCPDAVWRYDKNPIITRRAVPRTWAIYNSAVVPYQGAYAGVFRVDNDSRDHNIHAGRSANGIDWDIDPEPINPDCADPEVATQGHGYDPRVIPIDGKYYVVWCNIYHGPTIGLAVTEDFKIFTQLENAFLPYNRNGVLFPRKVNGHYLLLSRPSDLSHTGFGDIYLSQSPDLEFWGRHRFVMGRCGAAWDHLKIGGGPAPIETSEGWLMFYHGVLNSCNGYVYSWGAALLDLDEPWKVITRGRRYLMAPTELYESVGGVPNVTFPCACLCDGDTGRLAVYYGAADTVVALAFTTVDDVIDFIREDPV